MKEDVNGVFRPGLLGRNAHLQTIGGSLKFRIRGPNPVLDKARKMIISTGEGTRLLGYYTPQYRRPTCGLVALIHGWEGSSDSTYILSTSRYLYLRGYDIFRLNLRDHGDSHHLNEGLFHGALLEETSQAVAQVARLAGQRPFYLVGFSLGGNFALRIALRQGQEKIENLRRVFAISPALDPYKATLGIDSALPVYRYYFLRKWKNSLRKKAALYPHLYDFSRLYKLDSCLAVTEAIMPYFPEFPTYRDYFHRYTLKAENFSDLSLPVTIYAALDDPIIPPDDLLGLKQNDLLRVNLQKYGGHCGFLSPFPFGCWYEREIARLLEEV